MVVKGGVSCLGLFLSCIIATSRALDRGGSERIEERLAEKSVIQYVIGGDPVSAGTYPWFARVTTNEQQSWLGCGGSLISPEYVLTAAHCISLSFESRAGFQIGALCSPYQQGNNCGQHVEEFGISSVTKHPDFDLRTYDNDFALVRLDGTSTITPVDIDTGVSTKYGKNKKLWVAGFGNTNADQSGYYADTLQHVEITHVQLNECKSQYGASAITENMLCAADPGEDSCKGDSGGPLYDAKNKVISGVVSFGKKCADSRYPGVYARISSQFEWIKETVCSNHSESTKPSWCSNNTPSPVATPPTPFPTTSPFSFSPTNSYYPSYELWPTASPVTSEPTITPEECPPDTVATVVKIRTDDFYYETSWEIKDSSDNVLLSRLKYSAPGSTYYDRICLDPTLDCYSFTIYDSYGDGLIFGGFYEVFFNGETVAGGDVFEFSAKAYFGSCNDFNPCGEKMKLLTLELQTDNYGSETSWKLQKRKARKKKFRRHKEGGVSLYELYWENSNYVEQYCLRQNACYKFKIFDSFGDGMCCMEGEGGYRIKYGSKVIRDSKFEGGFKEISQFGKCKK